MIVDYGIAAARCVYLIGLFVLFGTALLPFYVRLASTVVLPGRAVRVILALGTFAAALAWLALLTDDLRTLDESLGRTIEVFLVQSSFGTVWIPRLLACALLVGVAMGQRPGPIVGASLCLLVLEGRTGHAAAWSYSGALVQVGHVVCGAAWTGALVGLGQLVASAMSEPSMTPQADAALRRFSAVGMAFVLAIVATGIVNTWNVLGAVPRLSTSYDRTLILKLSLVAVMVATASVNRFWLLPTVNDARVRKALLRTIWFEQATGLLVLLVVSVLGTLNPAV